MKNFYKKISTSLVILTLTFLFACSGTSPEYQNYSNQLKTQMQDMYNTLFAGHASDFLQNYVDPAYIKSMGGIDQTMLQFGNSKQQALMAALKLARNMQPTYDESTKTMIYSSTALARPIAFKMLSGKWYLQSDWLR